MEIRLNIYFKHLTPIQVLIDSEKALSKNIFKIFHKIIAISKIKKDNIERIKYQ